MKVREVMTTPVVTVGTDATFVDLVEVLLANDISGVPVVDSGGELVGLVTEADLVSKDAYGYRRRRPLGLVADYLRGRDPQWVRKGAGRTALDLMTRAPTTASAGDDLRVVARRMLEGQHKRLPVVEDGRVVGIVSRHDLLRPYHRTDPELLADVDDLLGDVMRVPESHNARASVADGVVTIEGSAQWHTDVALIEAIVAGVPGVVAVENRLVAREPDPRLGSS